jgi:hypothetical protein
LQLFYFNPKLILHLWIDLLVQILVVNIFFDLEESSTRDLHLNNSGMRLIAGGQNLREEQQIHYKSN